MIWIWPQTSLHLRSEIDWVEITVHIPKQLSFCQKMYHTLVLNPLDLGLLKLAKYYNIGTREWFPE